jgi:hypothetical protein
LRIRVAVQGRELVPSGKLHFANATEKNGLPDSSRDVQVPGTVANFRVRSWRSFIPGSCGNARIYGNF